jgi:hypothetical protein
MTRRRTRFPGPLGYRHPRRPDPSQLPVLSEGFLHHRQTLSCLNGPITDKGVAVGGAFDSDTATVMTPITHGVAGVLACRRS